MAEAKQNVFIRWTLPLKIFWIWIVEWEADCITNW